jgi:hypothetical protein
MEVLGLARKLLLCKKFSLIQLLQLIEELSSCMLLKRGLLRRTSGL